MNEVENAPPISQRVGYYSTERVTYPSFIPHPLPPKKPSLSTNTFSENLSKAEDSLKRLNNIVEATPYIDICKHMFYQEDAVHSSQIENLNSSVVDFLIYETTRDEKFISKDTKEAYDCYVSTIKGLDSKKHFSKELILYIHKFLMANNQDTRITPGVFRTSAVYIASGREIIFTPTPANQLHLCLDDLEKFMDESNIHPLIKIGLSHPTYEQIHPFPDGNGRTGRTLITLLLKEYGFLHLPIAPISKYIHDNQMLYYQHLNDITKTGNWESWLNYFLQGISLAAESSVEKIAIIEKYRSRDIKTMKNNLEKVLTENNKLIDYLFLNPFFKTSDLMKYFGLNKNIATTIIDKLHELKIVDKVDSFGVGMFEYRWYVELFSE